MTPEQFAYWLQGFVELNPSMQQPTPEQWKAIGEHLQTVFKKVTPQVQAPPWSARGCPCSRHDADGADSGYAQAKPSSSCLSISLIGRRHHHHLLRRDMSRSAVWSDACEAQES